MLKEGFLVKRVSVLWQRRGGRRRDARTRWRKLPLASPAGPDHKGGSPLATVVWGWLLPGSLKRAYHD